MKRQPMQQQLSFKSRSILFILKHHLTTNNKNLQTFIGQLFGFYKQKFNKNQFQKIIKFFDKDLIYEQIDELFDQLDQGKNNCVFLGKLKQVYETINQHDNPKRIKLHQTNQNNSSSSQNYPKSIFSAKIFNLFSQQSLSKQSIIHQTHEFLLQLQDLHQIVDIFAIDRNGFISIENVIQLFKNIQLFDSKSQEKKKKIILEYLFQNKNKIPIQMFLKKLQLENTCKRVNINQSRIKQTNSKIDVEDIDNMKDYNNQLQYKQQDNPLRSSTAFVKNKLRESVQLQQSIESSKQFCQYISIQSIPSQLQPYYNYGSQLCPQFAKIALPFIKKQQIFIDPSNPSYSQAFQWIHYSQINNNYTLFQINQSVLMRQKHRKGLGQLLQSKDIQQGRLGDCYFLSAISAIVERYPQLVYRLFVLDKNPSHIYGVKLFIDGKWKTVLLDACFPIDNNGHLSAAQAYKHQIWVMLLEKAWAKVFNSYDNVHSGYNEEGLNAISGAPCIPSSNREEGFLKKLQIHLKKGAIITCATSAQVQQMTTKQQDDLGIYSNHAYTLISVHSDLKYKSSNITLIKIRNPWGRKQWKGDWSYYSSLWTKQLKQRLNYYNNPNDGTFYMDYNNFLMYFNFVNICRVNLAYVNSTFILKQSNRNSFYTIKLKIKQAGDYFFTQYQQNPRKYKNSINYQKSNSWMYLSKIQKNDKRKAIGSKTQQLKDNTLEVSLDQGEYIMIVKTNWKFWQSHQQIITSYGPQKVQFHHSKQLKPQIQLSNFITSCSSLFPLGKTSTYQNFSISKRIYFDPVLGYGYIQFLNLQSRILNTTINMLNAKGLTVLQPHVLPINLTVFPNQSVLVKFIVEPSGYAYQYSESYYLENM